MTAAVCSNLRLVPMCKSRRTQAPGACWANIAYEPPATDPDTVSRRVKESQEDSGTEMAIDWMITITLMWDKVPLSLPSFSFIPPDQSPVSLSTLRIKIKI